MVGLDVIIVNWNLCFIDCLTRLLFLPSGVIILAIVEISNWKVLWKLAYQ